MIVCQCNVLKRQEIEETIIELLDEDAWRLIVPVQVYHAMNKRGRCCGCFPNVVDIIVEVTAAYHKRNATPEAEIISLIERMRSEHEAREAARREARRRLQPVRAA